MHPRGWSHSLSVPAYFSCSRPVEDMWERLRGKLPSEDAASASAYGTEEGRAAPWRQDNELDPQLLFEVISSRNAISGAGYDRPRFSHRRRFSYLQSISYTDLGARSLAQPLKPSGGGSWTVLMRFRRSSGSTF